MKEQAIDREDLIKILSGFPEENIPKKESSTGYIVNTKFLLYKNANLEKLLEMKPRHNSPYFCGGRMEKVESEIYVLGERGKPIKKLDKKLETRYGWNSGPYKVLKKAESVEQALRRRKKKPNFILEIEHYGVGSAWVVVSNYKVRCYSMNKI